MTQDFIALYGSMKVRFELSSPFMFKFISIFDSQERPNMIGVSPLKHKNSLIGFSNSPFSSLF
jgi:hypothetical protein